MVLVYDGSGKEENGVAAQRQNDHHSCRDFVDMIREPDGDSSEPDGNERTRPMRICVCSSDDHAQRQPCEYEHEHLKGLAENEACCNQQCVALAKIIAISPDVILKDEPTGSLDEQNRNYVVSNCASRHIAL